MLDLDGGAPWDLLCSLMQAAPRKRLSAAAAVAHPALGGGLTGALNSALWRLGDAADKVCDSLQQPLPCKSCLLLLPPLAIRLMGHCWHMPSHDICQKAKNPSHGLSCNPLLQLAALRDAEIVPRGGL